MPSPIEAVLQHALGASAGWVGEMGWARGDGVVWWGRYEDKVWGEAFTLEVEMMAQSACIRSGFLLDIIPKQPAAKPQRSAANEIDVSASLIDVVAQEAAATNDGATVAVGAGMAVGQTPSALARTRQVSCPP